MPASNIVPRMDHVLNINYKSKNYVTISPGLQSLAGPYSQAHKIFGITSRNKQSPATCIVSAAYNKIVSADLWERNDLQQILTLGDKLYRTSITMIPFKPWQTLYPNCVYPTFYIGQRKVTIFVGNDVIAGETTMESHILSEVIAKLLKIHYAIILNVQNKNLTLWNSGGNVYCFCPHDGNGNGGFSRLGMGKCFVLRSENIDVLCNHLSTVLQGGFTIYSVSILKLSEIASTISDLIGEIQNAEQLLPDQNDKGTRTLFTTPAVKMLPPAYMKDIRETSEMFNIRKNSNFLLSGDGQGSLLHTSYENNVDMIIFDNLAAIVTLHKERSVTWTSRTIADIINLGHAFSEVDLDIDAHISGILQVQAHELTYILHFEKILFGKVTSKDDSIPTIASTIELFFAKYDAGLIDGPQSLAIWKENGLYFSFDAKERDVLGRKWMRTLARDLNMSKMSGGACVLWFDDSKKLAAKYISNVPLKHRNDSFRIISIEVEEQSSGDNWNDWQFVSPGRWIIRGPVSICKYVSSDDFDRRGKLHAAACYTLAFLVHEPEHGWNSNTLEQLLKKSFDFYKRLQLKNLKELKTNAVELEENVLNITSERPIQLDELSDIGKNVVVNDKVTILSYEECAVTGKCIENKSGESGLRTGLKTFFQNYHSGIITIEDSALLMWTDGSAFYILDYSERMNMAQLVTKSRNNLCNVTALRFQRLTDLIDIVVSNPKYLACEKYCISKVEATYDNGREVPLRNYEQFGERAAILSQPNHHEGQSIFEAKADKQTLCNLITALCFASITNSAEWSKIDIVDILRTGDKIYSAILENFNECEIMHRDITWNDIQPQIGATNFSLNREEYKGILSKQLPSIMPRIQNVDGALDNNDIENSLSKADYSPHTDTSYTPYSPEEMFIQKGEEVSPQANIEPDTLETLLKTFNSTKTFYVVLECDFFRIAIWKQNDLFFIFDPKANDKNGFPSPRRIQEGIRKVQIRIAEKEKEKLIMLSAMAEADEEGEDFQDPYYSLDEIKSKTNNANQKIVEGLDNAHVQVEPPEYIDITTLPNEGSAYVAWFQTLEGILSHITSKLPSEHLDDPITFHVIHIDKRLNSYKKHYFKNYEERDSKGFSILRASISQNDHILPNRELIDGSTSIIALAFTMITPAEDWSSTIIDIILKYGDRLYSKSKLQVPAFDEKTKLKTEDLAKSFSIYKFKFDYSVKHDQKLLTLNNPERFDEINPLIVENINKIGTNQNIVGALIKLNGHYHVAVWKSNTQIFIFDPFGTDADGRFKQDGVSCVMRFLNFGALFRAFRLKFHAPKEAITCQISEVEMILSSPIYGPIKELALANFQVPAPQSAFIEEEIDTKILYVTQKDEYISEVLIDLAAIVLSHLLHAECWTPTIVNKVFSLAQHLQANSTEIKVNISTDKVEMDLKGLVRCFTIDDTICTLNIDEVIRGPIIAKIPSDVSLRNCLTLLMRNASRAIVITTSFICAVWREENIYFLFNASDRQARPFVMSSKSQDSLYDWMIINRPLEEICNWYDMVRVEIASTPKFDALVRSKNKLIDKRFGYMVENIAFKKTPNHVCLSISPNTAMVGKSQTRQSRELFKRGKAACVVAAGMCHLSDVSKWNKEVFDIITRSALLLYMDSVAVHGRTSIEMASMEKKFQLQQVQMQVEALPALKLEINHSNIMRMLKEAHKAQKIAYLSSDTENFLVILSKKKYYTFHPEKISVQGNHSKAFLRQFNTLEEVSHYLLDQTNSDSSDTVSIGTIEVLILS